MADKKLTLVVQAKNMLARGLASVGNSLASIGKMAGRALGTVAKWAGIAASALGGISAVGAIRAFVAQEKAERDLTQALELHGDAVDVLLPKYKKLAAAIQDETGFADEKSLSLMAQARMYGATTDQIEDTTKGTIALTRAGMGEEMSIRALVAASKGNYEALTRYIPALKTANTEAEKAAVVNEFLSRQYAAAKGDLHTVTGAWTAMRGRISDALEKVGQFIVEALDLPGLMNKAADAAKRFGDRLGEWLKGDQFKAIKENIEGIVSALGQGGAVRNEVLLSLANVMLAALKDGGNYIANAIKEAMVQTRVGRLMMSADEIARTNLRSRGQWQDDSEIDKAFARLSKATAAARATGPGKASTSAAAAIESINVAAGESPEAMAKATEDRIKEEELLLKEKADLDKRLAEDADARNEQGHRAELARNQKILAMEKHVAAVKIRDFIEHNKLKEKAAGRDAKQAARDEARADRLRRRGLGGGNIGKANQEWLDAFDAVRNAQAGAANAQQNLDAIQAARDAANTKKIVDALAANNVEMKRVLDNLEMG